MQDEEEAERRGGGEEDVVDRERRGGLGDLRGEQSGRWRREGTSHEVQEARGQA